MASGPKLAPFEASPRGPEGTGVTSLKRKRRAFKIHIIQCPPHELFPWEYAMTRKPPPNPRHCSWMPEELFP